MLQIGGGSGGRQEHLEGANAVGPRCRDGPASTGGFGLGCGTEEFGQEEVGATGGEGTGGGAERGSRCWRPGLPLRGFR